MPDVVHFILKDDSRHDRTPIVPAYGYAAVLDSDHSGGLIRVSVQEMAYLGEHLSPIQLACYERICSAAGGILIDRQNEIVQMDHPERVITLMAVHDEPEYMRRRIVTTTDTGTGLIVQVRYETYESLQI